MQIRRVADVDVVRGCAKTKKSLPNGWAGVNVIEYAFEPAIATVIALVGICPTFDTIAPDASILRPI